MTRSAVVAASLISLALVTTFAQSPAPPAGATAALVERAGQYIEAYEKDFGAVVCEEQQVQKLIRPDGRLHQQRDLKSDLAMVKIGTSWMQSVFRDVIEVDHKPVRNREDRLRKLFLEGSKTAVEQAQAVARESARYNIGTKRTGNSPLLPLRVVHPHLASGFGFTLSGSTLTYTEFRSPTYLKYQRGGTGLKDLFSHGTVDVDASTGRILAAELTADAPAAPVSVKMTVRYREDPQLKQLVPEQMTEEYWQPAKPKEDRLVVTSTYASFRRFQVSTTEIIKY